MSGLTDKQRAVMFPMNTDVIENYCKPVLTAVLIGLVVIAINACGSTEPVCQGARQTVVLVVSTNRADLAADRALAPQVAAQAVRRAATSCGRLMVGLADNRPEADLALQSIDFTPPYTQAYNRTPLIRQLVAAGDSFAQKNLLKPVAAARPTDGAPYLGALVKVGEELHVHGIGPATIILVGSGIEEERAPRGDGTISFADPAGNAGGLAQRDRRIQEFEPLLAGNLAGSCVMLIGAGANSTLSDNGILAAQALLDQVLAAARVGFVATRSPDVPPSCVGPARVVLRPKPHLIVATLSSDVVFQLNSAALQPGAAAALKQLLSPLAQAKGQVTVAGFADATGNDAINIPLSRARAATVAAWIEQQASIAAGRVRTVGFGSADPIASNATPAGRALNRRVVITIHTS